MEAAANPYERVPYEANAFAQTHPDRLYTVARLFGLEPARPERGRVLELGCAAGGNLLPMAASLPDARFLGVDLGRRMIELGRRVQAAAGLTNARLLQADITTLDLGAERFDYIVCHGVYSWVPEPVRRRILEIFRDHLAPAGVGLLSYNVYPGWHQREVARGMMRYHARRFGEPAAQLAEARALVKLLAETLGEGSDHGRLLAREAALLEKSKDYYVFHEHLEDENQPFYFHEVLARAEAAGLAYLGDAELATMMTAQLPAATRQALQRAGAKGLAQTEQYLDFLNNRVFRESLFVPAASRIERRVDPARLEGFHVAVEATPGTATVSLGTEAKPGPVTFEMPRGGSFTVKDPALAAALAELSALWPGSLPLDALSRRAGRPVAADILSLYLHGRCVLRPRDLRLRSAPPGRPRATALQRAQAEAGVPVASLRHTSPGVGDLARRVLPLCDGTRDAPALVEALVALVRDGAVTATDKGAPVTEPAAVRALLAPRVEALLKELARAGFFADGG